MEESITLLPAPRRVLRTEGHFAIGQGRLISLQASRPADLRFVSVRVQEALCQSMGVTWEVTAGHATPDRLIGLTLRLADMPDAGRNEQGYRLSIRPDGILIQAAETRGLFYGACTLVQIIQQAVGGLPCLEIVDWPDFPARGVMLDVSRDKVPSMATLYRLIDMLAGWKINQLQLYTEHTFAYRNHPGVWANASPLTGQEIMDLDAFCRQRHIELVPNQNSFGHLERWLLHPRYMPLAEVCGEIEVPWGRFRGPFSLCPVDPDSLNLLRGLYDELLPHFTSRLLNVGCDETWDLGQGRSRESCRERGVPGVYLDFLLKIQAEVQARGRIMQFWGDVVMQQPHNLPPELQSSIALEWGYEARHPFADHATRFAEAGIPYYVCPGTSSWCSIAGRTDNALANLRNAAEHGLRNGAIGYLNTDWGDRGHWQVLPVSYLGFAGGAAYGWSLAANCDLDLRLAVSRFAFGDPTGAMGRMACDLGNVYRSVGIEPDNSSVLFTVLADSFEQLNTHKSLAPLTQAQFRCAEEAIDEAMAGPHGRSLAIPDADLVRQELALTARMLHHACRRGLLWREPDSQRANQRRYELDQDLQGIIIDYQTIWMARNRPGGMAASVARLEAARTDYARAPR